MIIIKYILGSGLILGGIITASKGQFVTGILICFSGVLLLPFVSKILKTKIPKWNNRKVRYTAILSLFIFGFFFIESSNYKPKNTSNETIKTEVIETSKKEEFKQHFWKNYSPSVKERITQLIKNKDCKNLQKEFDLLVKNDKAKLTRTGKGNADLMNFIGTKINDFDCYK